MRNTRPTNQRFAVGIPSRGRTDRLVETLEAFFNQTVRPAMIVVIDNNRGNDINLTKVLANTYTPKGTMLVVHNNASRKTSDAEGSQIALEYFNVYDYKIGVKWDDDLVPEPDCMERLLDTSGYLAVGGMYPKEKITDEHSVKYSMFIEGKGVRSGNKEQPSHLQFYPWHPTTKHKIIEMPALYSSFMYCVPAANLIGGFAGQEYSQHSYKHETDFTLRLARLGPLAVRTDAAAVHKWSSGGVRSFTEEESIRMHRQDEDTFNKRMKLFGIDPLSWRHERGTARSI